VREGLAATYQYREFVAGCVTAGVATLGTPAVGAVVVVDVAGAGDADLGVGGAVATYCGVVDVG
jgi:hypothetical protein